MILKTYDKQCRPAVLTDCEFKSLPESTLAQISSVSIMYCACGSRAEHILGSRVVCSSCRRAVESFSIRQAIAQFSLKG